MAELMFHGAAEEVTGSMHLVRVDDKWVALDCGLYQGRRQEGAKIRPCPPMSNLFLFWILPLSFRRMS